MKRQSLNQTLLKLTALALSTLALTACGASKTSTQQSASYSSRNHPGQNGDNSSSSSGPLLECNKIPSNTSDVEGRLTTYYDNGNFTADWIRLKFDRLPMQVTSTSSTHYLQMFRWTANATGGKSYNSTPVSIYFFNRTTKTYLNKDKPSTKISKAEIQNLINDNKIGSHTTTDNFFEKYLLVLSGMDLTYDAITFAIYDENQGTKAIASHDALLPAFSAEPNAYAAGHPETILQQLHPYWSERNNGLDANHFLARSYDNCIP